MKYPVNTIFSLSFAALLLTGCYTQLEVVERPTPYYDRFERANPQSAYNPQDPDRLNERAYQLDQFDQESYLYGYDDGFSDLELYFRDFNHRPPLHNRDMYALGYYDGYRDASWDFHRHRFRARHFDPFWDPFYYDSYWAFHMSWGWHRPVHFWHPHAFYGYHYRYPVYYSSWHHRPWFHGYHGTVWVVYNPAPVRSNVVHGPRASGVSRDRQPVGRDNPRAKNRSRTTENTARSSGVSRDTDARSRSVGQSGQAPPQRGNVGRTTNTGRSSGTVRSGGNRGGNSGGVQSGNQRDRGGSGTVGNRSRGGSSSSGTVRSGGNRGGNSGGVQSGSRNRGGNSSGNRSRNDNLQSQNQLPVITPATRDGRSVIQDSRPEVRQPVTTSRNSTVVTIQRNVRTDGYTASTSGRTAIERPAVNQPPASRFQQQPAIRVNNQPAANQRPATNHATQSPAAAPQRPNTVQRAAPAPAPQNANVGNRNTQTRNAGAGVQRNTSSDSNTNSSARQGRSRN